MAGSQTTCGCMTARTACQVIGWIEVVFTLPALIGGIVFVTVGLQQLKYADRPGYDGWSVYLGTGIGILVGLCVGVIPPGCLLRGVYLGKPSYLIPYIVWAVLTEIFIFVAGITIACIAEPAVIFPSIIIFVIQLYAAVVVYRYYKYLSEKPFGDSNLALNSSDDYARI